VIEPFFRVDADPVSDLYAERKAMRLSLISTTFCCAHMPW
jgi:hypothetical protein